MMAFIINTVKEMEAKSYANETPNRSTFVNGVKRIINYGFQKYPDFKWGSHEPTNMTNCLNELVARKLLMRGTSAKRVSISCMVLLRMAVAWIDHLELKGPR